MGILHDLRNAKKRGDLAQRVTVEVDREGDIVREARVASLAESPESASLAEIPFTNAGESPNDVVLRRKFDGHWHPVTAAEFASDVTAVARGIVAAGVPAGGRVAVMSRTRYEWTLLDFAIWAAGAQSIPIYPTSSADQVSWILRDSGAELLVVETADHSRVAAEALATLEHSVSTVSLDDGAVEDLRHRGGDVDESVIADRRETVTPADIATIVYTSGTTGRPKGCVITHGNLHAQAANTVELLHPVFVEVTRQKAATLLFLPLAHILGRSIQIACLQARIVLGHCPSIQPDELRPELAAFKPTFVVGVPYLFERIHDTARATAERMGRGASFERADRIAVRAGEANLAQFYGNEKPGVGLRLASALYDLLVYRRVRQALGGRLRYAISGGAPLTRRLNLFFFGAGIVIYEGYGLTETTSAATVVPPLGPRPGTVGLPVPGTAVRIADDGEVLIRGNIVFGSYWNNSAATKEVLDDGWFTTGDLGQLDDDGYLTITGRKTDVLVTSGGKNVSPSALEDRLRSRPPVGQCLVVGENRPYVAALVTLERDAVEHWLRVRRRPTDTPVAELVDDPDLRADIQASVDYANEGVSRAEAVRRFRIIDGEFTEQNGMLTPSLKVKRAAVARAYTDDIERLYEKA